MIRKRLLKSIAKIDPSRKKKALEKEKEREKQKQKRHRRIKKVAEATSQEPSEETLSALPPDDGGKVAANKSVSAGSDLYDDDATVSEGSGGVAVDGSGVQDGAEDVREREDSSLGGWGMRAPARKVRVREEGGSYSRDDSGRLGEKAGAVEGESQSRSLSTGSEAEAVRRRAQDALSADDMDALE